MTKERREKLVTYLLFVVGVGVVVCGGVGVVVVVLTL